MRERDIMYLSELIENRIISYCIKEEGSLQEHLNIGEETGTQSNDSGIT